MSDIPKLANRYEMSCEGFKWHTYARSPEEAEAHFRSNLAILMSQSSSAGLRSKASKVLRKKSLNVIQK